ncbi:putative zinc finger protein [Orchesella cincta]|uniref:Putative zinc finger protein n=1 Tax=Orchesella cincta TaxID=48709 RepID=A0A1D2MWI8_ORCCI|nr:putative zinc finger protein [Orchesella cincta]
MNVNKSVSAVSCVMEPVNLTSEIKTLFPKPELEHATTECKDGLGKFITDPSTSLPVVCRLCAFGNELGSKKWISLSEIFLDSLETVQMVLQKYVPGLIMMLTLPKDYPQSICECCLESLKLTKEFFDKIVEGQKRMEQLVKNRNLARESNCGGGEIDVVNTLSQNVLKRKRGRPKKTVTITSPEVNRNEKDVLVQEEPRLKRSTRPPCRYSSEVYVSNEVIDAEKQENDEVKEITGSENETSETRKVVISQEEKTAGAEEANLQSTNDVDTESVKSDTDRSVKLSDLLRGRQFSKRRKRGRPKSKKKQVDFRCEFCEKQYSSQSALVYHKLSAHDTKRDFQCTICKKTFSHKGLLTNHMFTHYSEKYFTCDEPGCISSYKSRASLYTHKRSIHLQNKAKEFTCEKCGGQFTLKSSLTAHMRLHTGEKPHICKYCGKCFSHRGNMKEHTRTHTKEKPYSCNVRECEKRFTTLSQLKIHKLCDRCVDITCSITLKLLLPNYNRTHSGSKPYLCMVCGRGFTFPDNLRCHMKRHSGEKSEECPICHKQFSDACSLKKHKRIHSGEKPFECSICKKTFSDPSNFAKHKKIHPPSSVKTVSDVVPVSVQSVATDNIQASSESVTITLSDVTVGSLQDSDTCLKDSTEAVQVSDCQTLVQILTPEAFAALSDGSSVTDTNPSDIFSVTVEEPSIEITTGESETVAIQEVIETLNSQDVITFATTESENGNPGTLNHNPPPDADSTTTSIAEAVIS